MNILVVGGGGREHAIIWKLAQSPNVEKIYCAPGNGGISTLAECFPVKATDIPGMVALAKRVEAGLVVVAPDDPLVLGMVDALEKEGIPAFGPRKNAAIIEGSKSFAKSLMQKYNIPTADFAVFEDFDAAVSYVREQGAPIVIKADGLALGKGVTVAQTLVEAEDALADILKDGKFGAAGARVVIEECMVGREASVLCFADGKTLRALPAAQDHKRVYNDDKGPNTGGMGAFAPTPWYTPELAQICERDIFLPTLRAMAKEGRPFSGVLYFGLMLTDKGPKVVEYNARFGDPETQCVLPLLKTDLLDVMLSVCNGTLDSIELDIEDGACACVVLASGGYPGAYKTGKEISGLKAAASLPDTIVFHAGTALKEGKTYTGGGRVLGVSAVGNNLEGAISAAYRGVSELDFEGKHYRTDIGRKK